MPDVKVPIAVTLALTLGACGEKAPDQNYLIDTNVPANAQYEALPPDESAGIPPENRVTGGDTRTPEERGDGDDMVRIIDDTSNSDTSDNRSEQ